jgi:acyl-CoA dehydrogenase
VSRFFIEGFGNAEQKAAWSQRLASVAISEPRVGAHPKLLNTRAEQTTDGYSITGEKAWVTNGPLADVFIVLAITSVEGERKRYSALLVPHDTPNLALDEAPQYRALLPSRHCGLKLDGCRVPHSALLGKAGSAYETMALPFRDVEDAVGTFGLLGAFRFLLSRLAARVEGDTKTVALGRLAALAAVFEQTAIAVVAALDAGELPRVSAALVGLRVLAAELRERARAISETDDAIERVLDDLATSLSVARGPREARQMRLALSLRGT